MSADLQQLDLFPSSHVQSQAERNYITHHRPLTLINAENYIQFQITVAENEFIQFNESYLYMRLRVTSKDKEGADEKPDWDDIKPINYFLNTLFNKVSLSIGNKDITDSMTNFMYKAYMEALLGYSSDAKKSHLSAAGWLDETDRKEIANKGKEFELMGRLHLDLTHQPRSFPGPCTIDMKLDFNTPEFVFLSEHHKPKYTINDVYYSVSRTIVSQNFLKQYKTLHEKKSAKIPFVRSYCRAMPISKSKIDESLEDVCRGKMPKRLYFGLVSNNAFNGNYKSDPFEFQDMGLSFLACYIDGIQYPSQAYQPQFDRGLCVREYIGLVQTLGQNNTDSYSKISYEQFKKSPIFAVNFEPDLEDGDFFGAINNPKRDGILRLQLKFGSNGLAASATAIIYLEFDCAVEIDSSHNVTVV